ncbi:ABC transporter [Xylariaceae sp. FL0594]|nr:ABC transporter [Xylariaceae sp. FL0594]
MSVFIAALPMYDWPECRDEVDAKWAKLRDRLGSLSYVDISAPDRLVRRNADMPPVPGGIRDRKGNVIAPDPASLPPDELDLATLWRHPALLLGQACRGSLAEDNHALARNVQVLGHQDYSAVEGGKAEFYSSAIVVRRGGANNAQRTEAAPASDLRQKPSFRLEDLEGKRFAYNSSDSLSGRLALEQDLKTLDKTLDIFSELVETGSHRRSIVAVAEGKADVAAIDCLTWQLAQKYEPAAAELMVVGWTAHRVGLPFIMSRHIRSPMLQAVVEALKEVGFTPQRYVG